MNKKKRRIFKNKDWNDYLKTFLTTLFIVVMFGVLNIFNMLHNVFNVPEVEKQNIDAAFESYLVDIIIDKNLEFAKAYGEDGQPLSSQLSSEQKLKLLKLLNSLALEDIKAGDGYKSSGSHILMKGYDGSDYLLEYDDSTETIYFIFDGDTHLRLCGDDDRYWETKHSDLVDYFLELTFG